LELDKELIAVTPPSQIKVIIPSIEYDFDLFALWSLQRLLCRQ